jgi:hypothetical protein
MRYSSAGMVLLVWFCRYVLPVCFCRYVLPVCSAGMVLPVCFADMFCRYVLPIQYTSLCLHSRFADSLRAGSGRNWYLVGCNIGNDIKGLTDLFFCVNQPLKSTNN